MELICPGCHKPIAEEGIDFETQVVLRGECYWHRVCDLQRRPEWDLMVRLFRKQDDWKEDPNTALADLIGDLGHFADNHGIDFEQAVRRGLKYWEEERVRPADEKER